MAAITPITSTVQAAQTAAATGTASVTGAVDTQTIAGNFDTFLQLLTTQLKNQNPLDPLDTNQFTQQLVSFAQVEQQVKQNSQLQTLISIEQSAQATTALAFVGSTVAVNGQTAQLANGQANWSFNVPRPVSATVTITTATGQTAYSGSFSITPGAQPSKGAAPATNATKWPDDNYTISITEKDPNEQTPPTPSKVEGVVDSVDPPPPPPQLSIG